MKKIIYLALACYMSNTIKLNAQNLETKNDLNNLTKTQDVCRLKTNPLSPMVAYEPNLNLSLEKLIYDEGKTLGLQVSAGYLFGWNTFQESATLKNLKVNGFVSTGEFRVYDKHGIFLGPYIQYKSINAEFSKAVANGITSNWESQEAKKITYSAGFILGYYQKIAKKIGSEFYVGCGISKKKLSQNNTVVDAFDNYDDFNLILDNSGRLPQFLFTYKITYAIN